MLLSEGAGKLQLLLDHVNENVSVSGMRFVPSKCEMLLHNWIGSKRKLLVGGEELGEVD